LIKLVLYPFVFIWWLLIYPRFIWILLGFLFDEHYAVTYTLFNVRPQKRDEFRAQARREWETSDGPAELERMADEHIMLMRAQQKKRHHPSAN
jgi:hypothetical protein